MTPDPSIKFELFSVQDLQAISKACLETAKLHKEAKSNNIDYVTYKNLLDIKCPLCATVEKQVIINSPLMKCTYCPWYIFTSFICHDYDTNCRKQCNRLYSWHRAIQVEIEKREAKYISARDRRKFLDSFFSKLKVFDSCPRKISMSRTHGANYGKN